ncbi:Pyrroline-5-carboxylate reductase [Mucinivorans hirudinis]|uniref:Pyrroline-5-carboxylate reductase n=1 Tax=Mucinivorans hirudinis TaxID=1433126 RepID=A0A060RD13_9BACT|nr:Pyrroline-5-carboxylate reductase [Mucinivorans hirudinis]
MKIAIVGAGNMGGAIAQAIIRHGFTDVDSLVIVDPVTTPVENIRVLSEVDETLAGCRLVLLAVKPWLAEQVAEQVCRHISEDCMVCSVVAGLTLERLEQLLGKRALFVVMPNTAVRVGEGMTFVAHQNAEQEEVEAVVSMFSCAGEAMVIPERQMGAAMALASCGVAYALRYLRAATEGGVELGMSAADGQRIVAQTMRGAAALVEDGAHPEAEIDKVTTAGGITIRGLNRMEECGFTNAVIQGLKASK